MYQGIAPYGVTWRYYCVSEYGPEGAPTVRRSDDEIRGDIVRTLELDPWVDERDVAVEVRDGTVTLSGEVDLMNEKRSAGDDAWDTPGVLDVYNNLRVRKEERLSRARRQVPGRRAAPAEGQAPAGRARGRQER